MNSSNDKKELSKNEQVEKKLPLLFMIFDDPSLLSLRLLLLTLFNCDNIL